MDKRKLSTANLTYMCDIYDSVAAKGEDLDAEEGDRHAEDGSEQVARD